MDDAYNPSNHMSHQGMTNPEVSKVTDNLYFQVKFTCTKGIMFNVPIDNASNELSDTELEYMKVLRMLAEPASKTITLRLLLTKKQSECLENNETLDGREFLKDVMNMPARPRLPYAQHLRMKGTVYAQANNMKKLSARLKHGSPHMPIPGHPEFIDPVEAEVKLAFDVEKQV
ncbi:uncharacterized protein K452DRAFT_127679 [Aplosporella prunicola CBS 121167]|uniref:Uncharacterized protein n=1 Tax=Aplosporella prunicola CBS 121167 TaxID=1176127 RepID=A0A6A6B1M7_9PEZI|nr:uncharacterized protein K452DRAFT_127679 [Aplosporella prunicola CBS 121167]KAF2136631.1 hypothetical protein K452DRAFT_127679 [Aplosporella prunicola CBS 121167]